MVHLQDRFRRFVLLNSQCFLAWMLRSHSHSPVVSSGSASSCESYLPTKIPRCDPLWGSSIKAQSDLDVVGESDEVAQLLSDVRPHHPDVVVLDFDLLGRQSTRCWRAGSLDHPPAVVGMSVRADDIKPPWMWGLMHLRTRAIRRTGYCLPSGCFRTREYDSVSISVARVGYRMPTYLGE